MKRIIQFLLLVITCCCFSQQADNVDFEKITSDIHFDTTQNKVFGYVTYDFKILKSVDAIYIDAKDMRFMQVKLFFKGIILDNHFNGYVDSFNDDRRLIIEYDFEKNKKYQLRLRYFANPKKALYFIDWDNNGNNKQIWTQGQGKYTSNWLPSIDDMNEKIEFDLTISFKNDYDVISNGKLINKKVGEKLTKWHYNMQKPMSSYLVALAIGKYNKKIEYSKSGIPLEMYYYPEDSLKFEPTYRYTKQMFDFLEKEIGVPYPWQNYKMVPVKDFLYSGMENTSLNIYLDAFVVDSIAFTDKNFINTNAHELSHQWFGDLVTETSGTHHWLHEGFATYYALLAEREVFGADYYYWRLYEYAQELLEQDKAGGSTSLLNPKSSSTTFYKKGAWVLHILREQVGDIAFKKGVRNYLKKHQFKNVETGDFINEIEKTSGKDLSDFVKIWLTDKKLYLDRMIESIKSNKKVDILISYEEIKKHILLSEEGVYSYNLTRDLPVLKTYFSDFKLRDSTFREGENYKDKEPLSFYKIAFSTRDIKVRQAIAQSLSKIPLELKKDYETLLDDKSYATIEVALFNLWKNFPEEQSEYLNKTKEIIGFNDKNIRILWLTLALITEDFELENKTTYFEELTGYTSSKHGFEIRQNAFQYLNQIQACNDVCKENLKQAATHHNWRFSKFSKSMLEVLETK